jgi:hypothetical protein
MAINPVSMTSQSVTTNTDAIIQVVYAEPDPTALLATADIPGRLLAFFNGSSGVVNLYMVDNSGLRLLRVA